MSTRVQVPMVPLAARAVSTGAQRRRLAYVGGVLALAAAYFLAAKAGQTLRYTASVAAMWPPAGVGIAALYLFGLRWWPGVVIGDLAINLEQHLSDPSIPLGSLTGQQLGNMAEIVVGALLLTRLAGRRATLDHVSQVLGLFAALAVATAISACVGTVSMLAGGVIATPEAPTFLRTWWLGDLAGALVVVGAALAWSVAPAAAWRRLRTWEGALMVLAVIASAVTALTVEEPLTYLVFPALIWSAYRFGPPGATLAIAIASVLAIAMTAGEVGPFFQQPIDHRTLGTQTFIVVTALTTLILSALVAERERSAAALQAAKLREGERAAQERRRIARDLHDSVSQALFSTLLHARLAERSLPDAGTERSLRALGTIADLTRGAQTEMRALIAELGRDPLAEGLICALSECVATVSEREGIHILLVAPAGALGLDGATAEHLFGIAREALANSVKHAGPAHRRVEVVSAATVAIEVHDDGRGFDAENAHSGHFGLESMRSRAAEIGAALTITSTPGAGTTVRVEVAR